MSESAFQSKLIKELESTFPGALVVKNDSGYIQGIPDLTVFYNEHWAMLECKKSRTASKRPNQEYYVNKCNGMSYANFIYPENKDSVINDLKSFFNK